MITNPGLIRKLGTTRSGSGEAFLTADSGEFFTADNMQFMVKQEINMRETAVAPKTNYTLAITLS